MPSIQNVLDAIRSLLNRFEEFKRELNTYYVGKEAFKIYWEVVNKDINNLVDKIREFEKEIRMLIKKDADQDVQTAKVKVKVAVIIGISTLIGGAIIGGVISRLI